MHTSSLIVEKKKHNQKLQVFASDSYFNILKCIIYFIFCISRLFGCSGKLCFPNLLLHAYSLNELSEKIKPGFFDITAWSIFDLTEHLI